MDAEARAAQHGLGDREIPPIVRALAGASAPTLVWRNDLDGLTFRAGPHYIKWNPAGSDLDLDRERVRLEWLADRHPAPVVVDHGADDAGQWLVTKALPGGSAVGDVGRTSSALAIRAIAAGLRALHAVPTEAFPVEWTDDAWLNRTPFALGPRPAIDEAVLVHGDACAPNTLVASDGTWTGNVDFGDLGVGDRWADLAVASMSLDWNYGEGHQGEFFEAYGIERDEERIEYYRALWHAES